MGNPSTIWAQLQPAFPVVGGIPFILPDGITVSIDSTNLYWDSINHRLSVTTNSDQTGTDSINGYLQHDQYWVYNATYSNNPLGLNGYVAGFTVSSSRGTGQNPTINQSADFIGKFSGWGFTGAAPVPIYQELAGMNVYAYGTAGSVNGIGGQLRLFTKMDNGTQTEWLVLSPGGFLYPLTPNSVSLGVTGLGFANLYLYYVANAVPGTSATINAPSGRMQISAGNSSITVTNSLVTATSVVMVMVESADATATFVKTVVPGAGNFVVTMNANATGTVKLSFFVVGN